MKKIVYITLVLLIFLFSFSLFDNLYATENNQDKSNNSTTSNTLSTNQSNTNNENNTNQNGNNDYNDNQTNDVSTNTASNNQSPSFNSKKISNVTSVSSGYEANLRISNILSIILIAIGILLVILNIAILIKIN